MHSVARYRASCRWPTPHTKTKRREDPTTCGIAEYPHDTAGLFRKLSTLASDAYREGSACSCKKSPTPDFEEKCRNSPDISWGISQLGMCKFESSRLMGIDEEGTLARLKAARKALVDPTIAEHRGRIVKTTGPQLWTRHTREPGGSATTQHVRGDGVCVR